MRPLTQCQSLRPLLVRWALTSSSAEAAVHPAAPPGHLMTLAPLAGRRHRRRSLLTRSSALPLPPAWRLPCTASQARRATRSSPAARCRRLS